MRIVVSSKCNAVAPSCGQVFSWEFYSGTVLNLPTTNLHVLIYKTLYNIFHNMGGVKITGISLESIVQSIGNHCLLSIFYLYLYHTK